jgi:pimeloyl-ACP methyl ester carboxylesterase
MFRTFFRASFADRSRFDALELHVNQRTATNMPTVASLVMGPLGPSYDLWPEAAAIRVPTLIVHGVEDLVPREMPRDLAHTIPNARLVMIDGAGHFPYIERPRETFAAMNDSSILAGARLCRRHRSLRARERWPPPYVGMEAPREEGGVDAADHREPRLTNQSIQ